MHFYNQDTVQPFHFEKNLSPTAVLSLSATFSPTSFPSSSTMSMIIIAITISNRHNHTYHHPWTRWPFVCFVFCLARNNMNRAARYSPSNQCNVYLGFLVTSDHHDDDDAALVSRTIMMFHDGHTVCVQHCALRHITHPTQYLPPSAFSPTNIYAQHSLSLSFHFHFLPSICLLVLLSPRTSSPILSIKSKLL